MLQLMYSASITATRGLVDALLEPEDNALEGFPGQVFPRLSMCCAARLNICHSDEAPTGSSTVNQAGSASAYPPAFLAAFAFRTILPLLGMRLTTFLLSR